MTAVVPPGPQRGARSDVFHKPRRDRGRVTTDTERKERAMSQENVDLVRGGYDDFNSGNIEGTIGRFHADVEWIEPGGGNAPAGTMRGPDSVANDVFAKVQENFDEFTCKVEQASDEGDTVVVTARFKGKNKSGSELDTQAEHVWEVRNGKITRFENKVDREAWAEGWS
jgi:ketosteroid isomerase-like protein